ncbi:sulfite exporter TauE/SafE family protein [Devosia sp. XJ19-1]|uniref:Sulfite exporter TauE/SafE family protein n=1 Tax=Devosia ureilytica TaxID=2952754 RepID=A0A9Q4AR85_9HYPH|nr:cytochrome c biogenesis protein CcdA [Devosia ureilytica]MCP8884788.1 sulfite exporter TauE/SafE family protein [Devosia ureilytica]MCP8888419.1 sulfite exporter TauE/SafE family protein [Devosia ureilytica]
MLDLALAFAAGLLTLINPCVLPLLPLIGASALARHRLAPLAMAGGMAISFTLAGLGAFALTRALGLPQDAITLGAGWAMLGFGLIMLTPPLQARFSRLAGATASGSTRLLGQVEGRGLWGEAAAGALLGLAWSPCIGPTLGGAIGLAAQGEDLFYAGLVMSFFALGAASVVLGLAYGTRAALSGRRALLMRLAPHAKTVLGLGLVAVGIAIVFRIDRQLEAWALGALPTWLVDLSVSL